MKCTEKLREGATYDELKNMRVLKAGPVLYVPHFEQECQFIPILN